MTSDSTTPPSLPNAIPFTWKKTETISDEKLVSYLSRRYLIYGLAALVSMTIYGGQVCPLVEGLILFTWFLELLIVFSILTSTHPALLPYVDRQPYIKQTNSSLLWKSQCMVWFGRTSHFGHQ